MFFRAGYVSLVNLNEIAKVESDDGALLGYRKGKLFIVVARQHTRAMRGRHIKSITPQLCGQTR